MQSQPLRKQQRRKSLVQQPEAARIEFLAEAARLVPPHAPQLAAHLVKEAAQVAARQGLAFTTQMSNAVCQNCGGQLATRDDSSASIAKLSPTYLRRKRNSDAAAPNKRQRPANTVALLQTCENCGTTNAKPYCNADVAAQAAGDANLRDLTNSKTSAPRAPSGEPEVMQRGTPSTNAAAQAQPSTLAILSLHPTEEGAATTTKSHSAVRGNNNASSIPVQSPIVAGNSTDALPPAAPHAAHMSMASQFAQQARPPVQPDFSTADNYGVQHNAAALPQMSDSVVQPELSLVQPPTRRGGADVSTVGGSHAASRGGSAVLGGHGMVGPTESVCSKHPRGAARPALSEKVGEATGGRVGAEGGGGHGGGQVGGRGSACRTTRGARGVMVADADDVVSIGTFASELSNPGRHAAGHPAQQDEEHVTSPIRASEVHQQRNGVHGAPPSTAAMVPAHIGEPVSTAAAHTSAVDTPPPVTRQQFASAHADSSRPVGASQVDGGGGSGPTSEGEDAHTQHTHESDALAAVHLDSPTCLTRRQARAVLAGRGRLRRGGR